METIKLNNGVEMPVDFGDPNYLRRILGMFPNV